MKWPFGPGTLVAAAFIGPGTVTACTLAGQNYGFALVWALIFATLATLCLQDMAVRLGVGARLGLGEALMQSHKMRAVKWLMASLVFVALLIGNCAYEAGNLAGGALGLQAIFRQIDLHPLSGSGALALIAALAIMLGRYQTLERLLIALVLLMSLAFLFSAVLVRPDPMAFLAGLRPHIPDGATLTAMALIGTTIVPYNLFLHAAAAREKWSSEQDIMTARNEARFSIGLGGLISILILSTSAASLFGRQLEVSNAADMALAIEPAFGQAAQYMIGLGLFAAGLSSAITAPMATAYALSELIGGDPATRKTLFRAVALFVIGTGALISLLGIKPVSLILMAQYANGLLLPVIAIFLLYIMNQKALMGPYTNGWRANLAGASVVLITLGLGLRSILRAAGMAL